MQLNLEDKHVLITGASKGIGARIAEAFAEEGSRLSLLARDEKMLQQLYNNLGGGKGGHTYHAADLLVDNEPENAINTIISKNGIVDIVVHNLGGSLNVDDPLAPITEWEKIWKLNVGIAIQINNLLISDMKKSGWGRVVMISSIDSSSKQGSPAYGAAKAYLNSYIRHVAWRLAGDGIIMCGIMPGPILADGNTWEKRTREKPEWTSDFIANRMPCGRLGTPDDLWPFVLLMSSELNQWAVGSLIELDGGIVI